MKDEKGDLTSNEEEIKAIIKTTLPNDIEINIAI